MSELANDLLPFDETASNEENYLRGVSYNITSVGQENYQQLTLRQGAFYTKDFKVVHADSNATLTEGVDYQFSYFCREVYDVLDLYAFSGLIILNKNLYGSLLIDARFVGGDYGAPRDSVIPNVIEVSSANDTYLWEDVEGVQGTFPVSSHQVSTKVITEGFDDMVAVLGDINTTIQGIGKVQPGITIDWIEGLQEILDSKYENGGLNQINRVTAVLNYPGFIEIQLPEVELATKTMLELSIATKDALYDITVAGVTAGAAQDHEAWASVAAKVVGPNRTVEILTGYRTNVPTLVIGPFNDGVEADKLMVNLNHYMVDGMSESFTPDFAVRMLTTKPGDWTNITNRFNANDHNHEISAINGLADKHSQLDGSINDLETVTGNTTTALNELTDAHNQLVQTNSNDHNSISQDIQSLVQSLNSTDQTLSSHIQTANTEFEKIATNSGSIAALSDFLKAGEETFTIPSGSTLTKRGAELDKAKVYVVTLVGSKAPGDVYQGILRAISDTWTSVAITMGSQQSTTPVLVVETGQIKVKCLDSTQSDESIVASVRCLDPANKLT